MANNNQSSSSSEINKENNENMINNKTVIYNNQFQTDFKCAISYCVDLLQQNHYILPSNNEETSRDSAILGEEMYQFMKRMKEKMFLEDNSVICLDNDFNVIEVSSKASEDDELIIVDYIPEDENQTNNSNDNIIETTDTHQSSQATESSMKQINSSEQPGNDDDGYYVPPVVTGKLKKHSSKSPHKTKVKGNKTRKESKSTKQNKLSKINNIVVIKCREYIANGRILTNGLIFDWAENAASNLQLKHDGFGATWLKTFKELNGIVGDKILEFRNKATKSVKKK